MKIIKGINRKWMKKNEIKGKVVHKVRTKLQNHIEMIA
jgi:hypothetical protein